MIAVIGNGLIGKMLQDIVKPDRIFDSKNIHTFQSYNTVYCAAPTGNRIWVQQNSVQDLNNILYMIERIHTSNIKRFVLISTCDTQVKPHTAYGKNRLALETYVASSFEDYQIIRLPMIIHSTITKNILWDIKHRKYLESINLNSLTQWFDLNNLKAILNTKEKILNACSESINNLDILQEFCPDIIDSLDYNRKGDVYDLKPFLYSQEDIFGSMRDYLT